MVTCNQEALNVIGYFVGPPHSRPDNQIRKLQWIETVCSTVTVKEMNIFMYTGQLKM